MRPRKTARDQSMIAQSEKRAHRRFPLSLHTEIETPRPDLSPIDSETLDVSASGVLFRTRTSLSVGDNVQFLLRFGPDLTMTTPPLLVRFWGTVIRSEERSGTPGFDHAIAVQIQKYEFKSSEV